MASGSLEQAISQGSLYLRLLLKHKWHILIGTLALTLLFTVGLAKMPNVYEATTTILVNPQQVPEKYVSPAVSSELYSQLNTLTQQVLSRTRLQEIIDRFSLYAERRGFSSPEEVIEKMRDDISVQVKQGTAEQLSTFTITYQGQKPALVAQVANELAASFIHWNISSRDLQVTGTQDFLSSELEAAKNNLQRQEAKLKQFKMKHLGETPDQTVNNFQAVAALRSALDANADAINRLDEQRILLRHLGESPVPTGASPHPILTERARLQLEKQQIESTREQLLEHYSKRYPDVVRATRRLEELNTQLASLPADAADPISSEKKTEDSADSVRLELIDREMKRRQIEQDRLQAELAEHQQKVDATPLREQQLVELTRNYEISKQHYQALLDGTFKIGMAADLEQKQKAQRFTVLDLAQVPQKPIKPRRKLLIPLSGLAALGLLVFGVFMKDRVSPAVKTEMELKSLLPTGVRIMGLIPRIEVTADARRARRFAICSSMICLLLCVALAGVIWGIRHNL
jgi:succinoglycan biosynthesis transport protein ExoP